jgi:hypothetical protein
MIHNLYSSPRIAKKNKGGQNLVHWEDQKPTQES